MPRVLSALRQRATAFTTNNAGAMRVSPGTRAGKRPVAPNPSGETTLRMGKQVVQGPTTGFGSFRTPLSDVAEIQDVLR